MRRSEDIHRIHGEMHAILLKAHFDMRDPDTL